LVLLLCEPCQSALLLQQLLLAADGTIYTLQYNLLLLLLLCGGCSWE
jgi:hypothetical protein